MRDFETMVRKTFPLAIVLLFTLIAGMPLLNRGLPPTHDGEYHIVRFYEFDKTLRDGNWYPRWTTDFNKGYGIPLFSYVYPLPNYVASFFYFLGFSFIDSFKLNMFFAAILGAVFFYLWAKEFWGGWGGLVGSVFYTFSPYHFVDIYIRGSVGEVWALAFFPGFLWAITKFIKEKKQIFLPISSLFLALIIFSHNILALMFFFFALFYIAFLITKGKKKKYLILNTLYIILLSLGLSAIFWIPAVFERQYVRGLEIFDVSRHFPDLYQLLIPSWGSGFSGEGLGSSLSFQIGIANLLAVMMSLVFFIARIRRSLRRSNSIGLILLRFLQSLAMTRTHIIVFFLAWFFLIFFLMLKISLPIWKTIPFMNYFQFPWRFLSLEILIASFLAGSIVYFWKSKIVAVVLVFVAFFLGIGYSRPAYYHYRDDNYYLTRSNFIDGTNSPGNVFNTIFFDRNLDKEKARIKFVKGKGKIEQESIKTTYYKFSIETVEQSKIQVNTAYFPGWKVFVDGKEVEIDITNQGVFTFSLPKGSNIVEIKFEDTPIRKVSLFISLISLFAILTYRRLEQRLKY